MADELFISATFDGSSIITGMDEVTSAIQSGSSEILDAFEGISTGFESASQGASQLIASLTEVGTTASEASPQLLLFNDAITASISPEEEAIAALQEHEQGIANLQAQLIAMQPVIEGVAQQYTLFADAIGQANVQIVETGGAIADETGQLLLFTEAAADATGQLQLFETVSSEVAAAQAESAVATGEAAAGMQQYTVTLGEGVGENAALTAAIETLNAEVAKGVGNLENIALAQQQVTQAAEQLGLRVEQTAQGMNILAVANQNVARTAGEATAALDAQSSMMAYVGGRALALELGVGQLGFGFGLLARSSAVLGPAIAIAFPVIGAVLLTEVIENLITKFENLNLEIIKNQVQFDDLAAAQTKAAEAVELQNFKLEDQIAKYEGRPTENRLAIAAEEAQQKVEDLNKSLEDALQKELQLLQTGEIGLFKSIFSGKEETSDLKGSLQPKLEAYLAAASKLEEANTELQLSDTDAAEAAVESAKKIVDEKRSALDAEIANQQAAITKQKELQEASGAVAGAKGTGAVGKSKEEVDAAFASAEAQISAIHNVELAQELRKKNTEDQIDLNQRAAEAADAAEERARARITGEAQIRADQSTGAQRADIEKQTAEQRFRIIEDSTRLEVQREIASGEDRYKAELEANAKVLEARKKLTSDLLLAEADKSRAEITAAQAQLQLDQQTEAGPKLEAAVTADNARIAALQNQLQADISAITASGEEAVLALQTQGAEEQNKLDQERTRRAINELQREFNERKKVINDETKLIQDEINTRYSAEAAQPKREESEIKQAAKGGGGVIAGALELAERRQVADEELALLQRKTDEELGLSRIREVQIEQGLRQEEQAYRVLYQNGKISAEQYEKYVEDIERQITEVTKTEADKRQQLIAKEKNEEIKEAEKRHQMEDQLEMQISQGMAREIDKMLFQAKSFSQAMQMLWQDIAKMIIEEIIKVTTEWIAHVLIMKAIMAVLGQSDTGQQASKAAKTIAANVPMATSEAGAAASIAFETTMAGVPFPANLIAAPIAGETALGQGLAFAAFAAAESGWNVPDQAGGVFPTLLHPAEMVLDRPIAEGMRSMISRGMSTSGGETPAASGGGGVNLHYHAGDMHAPTGQGVEEMLSSHPAALHKIVTGMVRTGKINPRNFARKV